MANDRWLHGGTVVLWQGGKPGFVKQGLTVFVSDYELTDEQIVTSFVLRPLHEAHGLPREHLSELHNALKSAGQQVALATWPNAIQCVLAFDAHNTQPRPEQLLRAYKNAFATRAAVLSQTKNNGGA